MLRIHFSMNFAKKWVSNNRFDRVHIILLRMNSLYFIKRDEFSDHFFCEISVYKISEILFTINNILYI